MRSTTIHICQASLGHNTNLLKSTTTAKLLAMVKADGYGHGIKAVVPALVAADGFGVACMGEALQVKECLHDNDNRPIVLIEGVFGQDEWQQAIACNLQCVIHHQAQLEYALNIAPPPHCATRTVWLKYNTGMNRLGFDEYATQHACQQLVACGYQVILTSHFACADDQFHPLNTEQYQRFEALRHKLSTQFALQASLCNSAGFVHFSHAHYDWVRLGIALYGSNPTKQTLALKPVMSLCAKIIAIHHLKAGETVGYGASWQAQKDTTLGIVSIGYGDGYPRSITQGKVWTKGHLVPIVGRVAMDMLAIDLIDTPAALEDKVELWGEQLPIDQVASWADTISYELFCRLSNRPTRILT